MVFTCRWGILATGGIASKFAKDLMEDPAKREVDDVKHEIVAIASSTSKDRAEDFVRRMGIDKAHSREINCYGTYEELVENPDVDIVYVATPHSAHYENCKLALEAGKSVLCEKAFTINEPQSAHLIEIAREKKVFLMEAVWTRFFPLCRHLQKILFEDRILGKIHHVISDCCLPFDLDNMPTAHRLLNPDLGGGALLDLGVYALTWIFMIAYNDPDNKLQPPVVTSAMLKNDYTHVDESTNISLVFPKSHVSALANTSIRYRSREDDICRIQGDKGDIIVQWAPFRPTSFTIHLKDHISQDNHADHGLDRDGEKVEFKPPGNGMFYEADECARCIRDGKLESSVMPLEESRQMMVVLDTVRKQNDFTFPEPIEQLYK
jgi:dihydrodiol dehydrogenase / D-xylose 1-dehydrogenase (NADP)